MLTSAWLACAQQLGAAPAPGQRLRGRGRAGAMHADRGADPEGHRQQLNRAKPVGAAQPANVGGARRGRDRDGRFRRKSAPLTNVQPAQCRHAVPCRKRPSSRRASPALPEKGTVEGCGVPRPSPWPAKFVRVFNRIERFRSPEPVLTDGRWIGTQFALSGQTYTYGRVRSRFVAGQITDQTGEAWYEVDDEYTRKPSGLREVKYPAA